MIHGIDIVGDEIRWVRLMEGDKVCSCGRIPLGEASSTPVRIKQVLKTFFSNEKVSRFIFPLYGPKVRAKCFPSDKVDISELEDNVIWEAQFTLEYDKMREALSFDPLRSVGDQTWIVAAAAPMEEIRRQTELFPKTSYPTETALTALANAVLASKWGQKDVMILHLDRRRAFLVVISYGNPILMHEIPQVNLEGPELGEQALSYWKEELKLRSNFLPNDKRGLDYFLLSGEAACVESNAGDLGESLGLPGEVFNPFEGKEFDSKGEAPSLYTLAYACALRGEK